LILVIVLPGKNVWSSSLGDCPKETLVNAKPVMNVDKTNNETFANKFLLVIIFFSPT
jgi:hypothetical protein